MSRFLNVLLMCAIAATVAQAALRENRKQENQPMLKAVVHVNFADAERQGHGLKNISNDNLLQGITTVPSGAVEVIRKQQQGFGYFKP